MILPSMIWTSPFAPPDTDSMVKLSPSASLAVAKTSITTALSSFVETEETLTTGISFTSDTSIFSVVVAIPPFPSDTEYSKLSLPK